MSPDDFDYRSEMRRFAEDLASWAKARSPGFLIIPQNGQELFTLDGEPGGPLAESYLSAVDGTGREDLYYGWSDDGKATPSEETEWLVGFLDLAEEAGVEVLVTDYVDDGYPMSPEGRMRVDDAIAKAAARGYLSFPAPSRGLEAVPDYPGIPVGSSTDDIENLADAANFLYLIDPGSFASKSAYLAALAATDYDVLIIDAYWNGTSELSAAEVAGLKSKASGGNRLVIAYMSIGEAEDYRPYWNGEWSLHPPSWLDAENPDWPGNYKVRYWDPEWQAIIFGTDDSVLGYIVGVGFDGAYLDIIDAFEYFE